MRAYPLVRPTIVPALHNQGLNKNVGQAGCRGPAIGYHPYPSKRIKTRKGPSGAGTKCGPLNVGPCIGVHPKRFVRLFCNIPKGSGP